MNLNRRRMGSLWVTLILLLIVPSLGCATKEEKKAKHQESARQYIEKQEYENAVIELKNVIQLAPEDDNAYYELGEAYIKLKQGKEAFQSFARAAAINPDNLKAQLNLGRIFLLGKQTEKAREKADLILAKSPEDIEGLILLSGVQVQEKDIESAIRTLEKAVSIDPKHFGAQLSLSRLFVMKEALDLAEQAYIKAINLDPESRVPYLELASLYGRMGESEKAEDTLKNMLKSLGSNPQNLNVLASFYERKHKWDKAEQAYREASELSPKEDVTPLMSLAAYYARRQSYEQALAAVEKAEGIKQDDLNILTAKAHLYFDFKKMKEAESTVDRVLEKDKGHLGANFLKGRLFLLKGDPNKAFEHFDVVVNGRPKDPLAHHYRALSLLGKGERKLAEQDLLTAVEINPRLIASRLMLAQVYLRDRNADLARQQIEPVLKQSPRNLKALSLKGGLEILEGDRADAEAVFRKIVEIDPNSADGHLQLGLIYNLTNRPGDALRSFKRALDLNPFLTAALSLAVDIYLREKKYDEAIEICRANKKSVKEKPSNVALAEYLEGKIFLVKKDTQRAKAHFEKAIETDPNTLAPYLALALLYSSEGELSEAAAQYEAILTKKPNYLAGYMALGSIHDRLGEGEKAENYYRKALEIKKDFAPAANNLAWNLAERGGNIDEALSFAQMAKEQMPNSPSVMDTLGWIYYLKGSYLTAIAELQDGVSLAPDNPVINYHLGLVYYRNNQPDKAREFLEKALEIDQNFKGAEEARNVLKEIQG